MFCKNCGAEISEKAYVCPKCGVKVEEDKKIVNISADDGNNMARFLLTFFLGFIGSFIINHTGLKPQGWKSRTLAYFFLPLITCGIYGLVASICNFTFSPRKSSNIGYFKD